MYKLFIYIYKKKMIIYAAGTGGGMEIDMAGIYGNGIALTERVLDNLWTRQTVTLNNIANNDTPGFKSQFVTFEEELASKLSKADLSGGNKWERRNMMADAIDSSRPRLYTTYNESTRLDDNNVDMDQEQVDLVRTALEYQYMLNSINNDISRLQAAAKPF